MTVRNASLGYGEPMVWVVPSDHRILVSVDEAARKMRKSEEEVERLVRLGFLFAQHEHGEVKVEPAIVK